MFKTHKYSQYEGKGITGLKNLGNTCFMNSAIQCLSHTYELSHFLESKTEEEMETISKSCDEGVILKEWEDLRKLMYSENCSISPGGFLTNVQKLAEIKDRQIFTGFAQNDLTEFILFLCDCFHIALKRDVTVNVSGSPSNEIDIIAAKCYEMMKTHYQDDYSDIISMFYGVQVSSIKAYDKGTPMKTLVESKSLSIKPESFFMLDLPTTSYEELITGNDISHKTIYDCFDDYCCAEIMDGDNKWYNEERDEKQDVIKVMRFFTLPDVLIISFKRFNNAIHKDNTMIDIDINEPVDLSKYMCGYNRNDYKYEVFGVCDHYGNVMGGHYTSSVKNASGKWYKFDDMLKQEIQPEEVITNSAYCVFMRKCENTTEE